MPRKKVSKIISVDEAHNRILALIKTTKFLESYEWNGEKIICRSGTGIEFNADDFFGPVSTSWLELEKNFFRQNVEPIRGSIRYGAAR